MNDDPDLPLISDELALVIRELSGILIDKGNEELVLILKKLFRLYEGTKIMEYIDDNQ